jgi:hypothetical protein
VRAALAVAVSALLALAATPHATALELGIQDDRLFLGVTTTTEGALRVSPARGLALARELRVTTLRLNVRWSAVAVAPERYDLARVEAAVDGARACAYSSRSPVPRRPGRPPMAARATARPTPPPSGASLARWRLSCAGASLGTPCGTSRIGMVC